LRTEGLATAPEVFSALAWHSALTAKGLDRFYSLSRQAIVSDQCFVAMSFDADLQQAYEVGIRPALELTGFKSFRTDGYEHNEKIDDLIMAQIQRSYFLVADVTKHRQGVYFEAGYALGLGRNVIWLCREDDLKNAHFDTRQYNHISWKDVTDLKDKLVNRIRFTIPGAE
jgi:nucleoside 2-deoxyribosyltransferase